MKKIYFFTGEGKDPDGFYRKKSKEVIEKNGGIVVLDPKDADLIMVFGGDGTIMTASHIAEKYNIPILSLNLGRIGFTSELEKNEVDLLENYFNDNYTIEERMTFSLSVNNEQISVFNDAVIHTVNSKMIQINLYCGDSLISDYRSDGMIFSTPTGSTAYSLAAGGPIVDPRLECILVTSICPQSLSAKPMIFSADRQIRAEVTNGDCVLTIDGTKTIKKDDVFNIIIKKNNKPIKFIRLKNDEFYERMRKRMVY